MAGQMAIQGAQALRYNGYKIPLMRNLVKRAIRGGGGCDMDFVKWGLNPWGEGSSPTSRGGCSGRRCSRA